MNSFKQRLSVKQPLLGTFIKTPHHHNTEVLSKLGFDTLCLDAEHAPFDRGDLDRCILAAKANQQHVVVRIANDSHDSILNILDLGADGVVVPHVKSASQLERVIKSCYFGHNGRGYAGSTRMAGYTSRNILQNIEHHFRRSTQVSMVVKFFFYEQFANQLLRTNRVL